MLEAKGKKDKEEIAMRDFFRRMEEEEQEQEQGDKSLSRTKKQA